MISTTDSTCRRTVLALPWLLNGSLEAAERRLVREHLIACPACRAELARTRETLALFASARREAVSGAPADSPAASARRRSGNGKVLRRLAWAAMIAAVLASGGGLWLSRQDHEGDTARPAMSAQAGAPQRVTTPPAPRADVIFSTSFESGSLASLATAPTPPAAAKRAPVRLAAARPAQPAANRIAAIDFEGGNLERWQ